VCAANVTDEYRAKCLGSGMDHFSTKPVMHDELVRALKLAYRYHHPDAPTLAAPAAAQAAQQRRHAALEPATPASPGEAGAHSAWV